MAAEKGNQYAKGSKGGTYNVVLRELVGLASNEALALGRKKNRSEDEQKLWNEVLLAVVKKATPQHIDVDTKVHTFNIPLSVEEQALYAKIRLGVLRSAVGSSEQGTPTSMGDGQPDTEREGGTDGVQRSRLPEGAVRGHESDPSSDQVQPDRVVNSSDSEDILGSEE